MKFLVVLRPNGQSHGLTPEDGRTYASSIRSLMADGTLEVAYAFVAGGGAYVVNASDTRELLEKVRLNPLFRSSSVDVIPVADAVDLLEGIADYVA